MAGSNLVRLKGSESTGWKIIPVGVCLKNPGKELFNIMSQELEIKKNYQNKKKAEKAASKLGTWIKRALEFYVDPTLV